ncbi:hypothetical protein [Marmoricola sp. URHB0036]|uniref:hypothetical protein n=1 Tax=Marmoricola sp. URHB0036 TaxID=1298863 RepID=UPI0003FD685F|nr:hypothetical protein [Marmoricola sp. URHB0036]
MTDEPEPDREQEERVRALLADLGAAPDAAAVPPDVAARLDETLAGLVAEREQTPANVVPLRRRWAPRAAAAAAAVIVLGAGGVAAANLGVFDGTARDTSSADTSAGGSSAESLDGTTTTAPEPTTAPNALSAQLPRVRAASFDADVARLLQRRAPARDDAPNQRKSELGSGSGEAAATCPGPRTSHGSTTTPVLYDGTPAVLVVHPARAGERLVEAWSCGGGRVLDRARVPATAAGVDPSSPDPGLASPSPTP